MGLIGGFVVIRENEPTDYTLGRSQKPVKVGRQYYAVLQDWSPEPIDDVWDDMSHDRMKWIGHQIDSDDAQDCIQSNIAPLFGVIKQNTHLVNQKGWYNQKDIRERPSRLPLTNFAIKEEENLLLRLVNGAYGQAYYVWVEEHDIWIVAMDGVSIEPIQVDSVLINTGERYDLLIVGLSRPKRSVYRFIIETFDDFITNVTAREFTKNYGLANLRYDEAKINGKGWNFTQTNDGNEVDWAHQKCTKEMPCQVLNCPHSEPFIGLALNYRCITIDQLKNNDGPLSQDPEILQATHFPKGKFHEIFLNAHAGFNGWYYKMPMGIPYFNQQQMDRIAPPCDPLKCDRYKHVFDCQCFHHYEFQLGDIVQIVVSTGANMPHTFHVHGTKFYVMKTGLMALNRSFTSDLECSARPCLEHKWSKDNWRNGNVPGMSKNPPLRDTVIVPNLGYMVLRFRATNPGWFFAHCHLLLHNLGGMSFAFRVGTNEQMPIPPPNYPRHCGIYDGESDWNSVEKTQDHNSGKRFTQSWNLSLACLFFTILVYKCMFLK
ncbi:multicopper oxidase domain-containing protein [Ditylenchus destructor]|uniref:Multicopper oxidase domain-containing protein n=1 Tax=Ditylenchus destructor TaxID=166010 RepID=A0AAD4QZW3_9BILA|nr:multicopper oxidase domain-containing protein [Ditylenchus destructor]